MNKVNLQDGTICIEGKWLSTEDLSQKIQEKMHSGEMKFSRLAAALEELNHALENACTITVKLVLTKEDYSKLLERGKADDKKCIYKAINAFIEKNIPVGTPSAKSNTQTSPKKTTIKCAGCGTPIKIGVDQENREIQCPECGARGLIKPLK